MHVLRFLNNHAAAIYLGSTLLASPLVIMTTSPDTAAQESMGEDTYRYNPQGKRDPFFSPLHQVTEQAPVSEEGKTPLQRQDLGQFKLVGVLLETGEPRALIEDNSGLGYIVMRGTLIGSKDGVIKAIEPQRIIVEEYELDFYGQRQSRQRELQLVVGEADVVPGNQRKK